MKKNTPYTIKDAKQYDIPGGHCYLYPDSPTKRLSSALVEQDGRYPDKGYKQNKVCTEAMFVIEGNFDVWLGKDKFKLKEKDVLYIPPMTPYAIKGKGTSFVFIEPKWNSKQNIPVD